LTGVPVAMISPALKKCPAPLATEALDVTGGVHFFAPALPHAVAKMVFAGIFEVLFLRGSMVW